MTVAKHTLIACMKGNSEGVAGGVGGGAGRFSAVRVTVQCISYKNCNWLFSLKFKQKN